MLKRWWIAGGIILVLVVLAVGATVVVAQEPTATPTPGGGLGPRSGWGFMNEGFGPMGGRRGGFGPMMGWNNNSGGGRWGNSGPMGGWNNNFGPMGGRRGGFGPMMGGNNNFGPMGGRGNFGPMQGRGPGAGGWGGPEYSLLAVVAEQLEITPADLAQELQGGKTVAEVAGEHNVAVETLVEAFIAPRAERLAEMVTEGRIIQEQADAWLAQMKEEVTEHMNEAWPAQGYGRGMGFADQDGDGRCDCRQTPPANPEEN